MPALQILSEQIQKNTFVVTVIGQMDESNIDDNSTIIYDVINKIPEGGNLILNFSELEYMNSKSIGYTTDFYNKMTEKKGNMIIAEAQDHIMDILTVVGLSHIITMVSSLSEAKEGLGITPELEEEFMSQKASVDESSPQETDTAVETTLDHAPEKDMTEKVSEADPKKTEEDSEGFSILTMALVVSVIIVLIVMFV
jgi:anti-anti-sigma factor